MSEPAGAPNLLATIVAATRTAVAARVQRTPEAALLAGVAAHPDGRRFHEALSRTDGPNIIAECKRRSPSKGRLRADYDPARIAAGYEAHGAAAVSVLTEPTFFDGSLDHLRAVRAAVQVPLLRKDFIVTSYQLLEAAASGADAVLLIVAALDDRELAALAAQAAELGLAVLVEVHDRDELRRALDAGARIIGVNNRNLRTLSVGLHTARDLIGDIPEGVVGVAESGLRTPGDLVSLGRAGYQAFLIGETFMSSPDPGGALQHLLDGTRAELTAVAQTGSAAGGSSR